jgi:hypothetical protein
MVQWELKQQGVVWSDLTTPAIDDDHISFIAIVGIMVFDALLYFLITWYLEGVFPGRYGVSKPWYFPFMRSYWCGPKHSDTCWSRKGRADGENVQGDKEELIRM